MILELLALNAANNASSNSESARQRVQELMASSTPLFVKLQDHKVSASSFFGTDFKLRKTGDPILVPISTISKVFTKKVHGVKVTVIEFYEEDDIYSDLSIDQVHEILRDAISKLVSEIKG